MLDIPAELAAELAPVQAHVAAGLELAGQRVRTALATDLPPVQRLCRHVERYHGKMVRPTLVFLAGLACRQPAGAAPIPDAPSQRLVVAAAVCEMIHLATLVHDDVLDDADTRRGADTVNQLRGNEAAVILGDFIFSAAYHMCSDLADRTTALAIARAGMTLCEGELLQLDHRGDFSIDEATYDEIVRRKTASLIATACRLGAHHALEAHHAPGAHHAHAGPAPGGGPAAHAAEPWQQAMERYGLDLGVAFQIQDDLLDLTGEQAVVGKPLGKDAEKGKLTLPLIHHLASAPPALRGRTLALLDDASIPASARRSALRPLLEQTGSIAAAEARARALVARARQALAVLPDTPARRLLGLLADAVVRRAY